MSDTPVTEGTAVTDLTDDVAFDDIDDEDIDADAIDDDDDVVDDDDDEDSDDYVDPDLAGIAGFDLEWEDRPTQPRAPRIKIEIAWEEKFEFLKEEDAVGKSLRVFLFSADDFTKPLAKARGRAKEIRSRLFATVPNESWTVVHRARGDGSYGVYVQFNKYLNDEELAERLAKYENRKAILKKAQDASPLVQRGRAAAAARTAQ